MRITKNYSPTTSSPSGRNDRYWKNPPTASVLNSTSRTSPTCTYCKHPHASNMCKTVTDVRARKEILRKEGRCYVCLKKGHLSRDRPSRNKCFKCDGWHHISILPATRPRPCPVINLSQRKTPAKKRNPRLMLHLQSRSLAQRLLFSYRQPKPLLARPGQQSEVET